jgi:holo-[acyl-carrier protein] synthase
MIKGIGIDIVEIQRVEDCINKYGDHFLKKVFTVPEIDFCKRKKRQAVHFAGRWAAKEAFFKALSLECQSTASWKSVQILAPEDGGGKPVIDICGVELKGLIKSASIARFHVSISHERTFCTAFVVAE